MVIFDLEMMSVFRVKSASAGWPQWLVTSVTRKLASASATLAVTAHAPSANAIVSQHYQLKGSYHYNINIITMVSSWVLVHAVALCDILSLMILHAWLVVLQCTVLEWSMRQRNTASSSGIVLV